MRNIYVIFDLVSGTSLEPLLLAANDVSAIRTFNDCLNTPDTMTGQHPQDFVLLHLGTIDGDKLRHNETLGPDNHHYPEAPRTVATGDQWVAARAASADPASQQAATASRR